MLRYLLVFCPATRIRRARPTRARAALALRGECGSRSQPALRRSPQASLSARASRACPASSGSWPPAPRPPQDRSGGPGSPGRDPPRSPARKTAARHRKSSAASWRCPSRSPAVRERRTRRLSSRTQGNRRRRPRCGEIPAAASLSRAGIWSLGTRPRNSTRSATPRSSASRTTDSRAGPSPITRNRNEGNSSASRESALHNQIETVAVGDAAAVHNPLQAPSVAGRLQRDETPGIRKVHHHRHRS